MVAAQDLILVHTVELIKAHSQEEWCSDCSSTLSEKQSEEVEENDDDDDYYFIIIIIMKNGF